MPSSATTESSSQKSIVPIMLARHTERGLIGWALTHVNGPGATEHVIKAGRAGGVHGV